MPNVGKTRVPTEGQEKTVIFGKPVAEFEEIWAKGGSHLREKSYVKCTKDRKTALLAC